MTVTSTTPAGDVDAPDVDKTTTTSGAALSGHALLIVFGILTLVVIVLVCLLIRAERRRQRVLWAILAHDLKQIAASGKYPLADDKKTQTLRARPTILPDNSTTYDHMQQESHNQRSITFEDDTSSHMRSLQWEDLFRRELTDDIDVDDDDDVPRSHAIVGDHATEDAETDVGGIGHHSGILRKTSGDSGTHAQSEGYAKCNASTSQPTSEGYDNCNEQRTLGDSGTHVQSEGYDNCDEHGVLVATCTQPQSEGYDNCNESSTLPLSEGYDNCNEQRTLGDSGTHVQSEGYDNCDEHGVLVAPSTLPQSEGYDNCNESSTLPVSEGYDNCDEHGVLVTPSTLPQSEGYDNCNDLTSSSITSGDHKDGPQDHVDHFADKEADYETAAEVKLRLLRNAYELRRLTTEGENDYEVAVDTGALEMMQNAFESIGPAVFPPEEQGDYELAQLHQLRFLGRAFESLGRTDSDGPEYDFCREV